MQCFQSRLILNEWGTAGAPPWECWCYIQQRRWTTNSQVSLQWNSHKVSLWWLWMACVSATLSHCDDNEWLVYLPHCVTVMTMSGLCVCHIVSLWWLWMACVSAANIFITCIQCIISMGTPNDVMYHCPRHDPSRSSWLPQSLSPNPWVAVPTLCSLIPAHCSWPEPSDTVVRFHAYPSRLLKTHWQSSGRIYNWVTLCSWESMVWSCIDFICYQGTFYTEKQRWW